MAYCNPEEVFGKNFLLKNRALLPAVGISTFRARTEDRVHYLVDQALQAGYKMFDTADMYSNEVNLRNAFASLMPKYNLKRSDLFITSKLICIDKADYNSIKKALMRTLNNLGLDYLDLYLVNVPMVDYSERKRFWHNVQDLYEEGYMSSIGVSNFTVQDLRQITTDYSAPMVNQVEWHPLNHNEELYRYCKKHDILLQAYSPLGNPFCSKKELLTHPLITEIAAQHGVTAAEVVLVWSLQQRVAVLPCSMDPKHLYDNNHVELRLTSHDITRIRNLVAEQSSSVAEL